MTSTRTADRGHIPSPRHAAVPVDPWNLPADPGACGCGSPLPPHLPAEHGEVAATHRALAEWESAR